MMDETILSALFLAVSTLSLVIQALALRRLWRWPDVRSHTQNLVYRGLLRTSGCRVVAAGMYVVMGAVTLVAQQTLPVLALSVFTAVQVLWQANAAADVRLRRSIAAQVTTPGALSADEAELLAAVRTLPAGRVNAGALSTALGPVAASAVLAVLYKSAGQQ
jgi:hypothetical protein